MMTAEFQTLQERNARVDENKAWETSWTRRLLIAGLTYVIAGFYMKSLGANAPWLNAFIPVGGYLLSTLSLPFVKEIWARKVYRK